MPTTVTPSTDTKSTCSKKRQKARVVVAPLVDHRAILARRFDVLAGCELQRGHHLAAEHLARRAQALQEVAG